MRIDPASAALIIQDLQNDIIGDGGAFADSGAPAHAASQNLVANVAALASAARVHKVPVIHVHYIVEPGAPGLQVNAPVFQGIQEAKAVVRGTWGAAPVAGLEPEDGDLVIEKMRMNGFFGTKLESLLRGFGTRTFIITGAWTNMSVEHSARHAADLGFQPIVASDGTATINDEWQRAALNYALTNIGRTPNCAEIVAALQR
jgi:gluconolactonase